MSFTFRQLEIFVEAAFDRNFRKTADRLNISQPAVSKQIRALELSLGKILFVRKRGAAAALSEEGRNMLISAQEMLAKQRELRSVKTDGPLNLRIVTGEYVLDRFIKPALPELAEKFPDISYDFILTSERERILEHIVDGSADLAIYTGNPAPLDFNSEIISVISCSLYATPAIAKSLGDDLEAIAKAPFVLPANLGSGSWVLSALSERGISPQNIVARTQFGDVVGDMIGRGIGIGILFDDHVRERFGDKLERLNVAVAPAYRVMIFSKKSMTKQAAPCVAFLRQICSSMEV